MSEQLISLNPATGETVWEGPCADNKEVNVVVGQASSAFSSWAKLSLADRIEYLNKFSDAVKANQDELAQTISLEMGKPLWESRTEVTALVNKVRISIDAFAERCPSKELDVAGAKSRTGFKPQGVVAVLGPFNLPAHLPNGHIVPALLAGNTIVFKPSEFTPLVAQKYMEYWHQVKLPKGVLNIVYGARQTGEALTTHKDIKGIFFTGSFQTGIAIHRSMAGRPDKILALEMGGNNSKVDPLLQRDITRCQKEPDFAECMISNVQIQTYGRPPGHITPAREASAQS